MLIETITDPETGEETTLAAATEEELDRLVAAHFAQHYALPPGTVD